jgi:hypothetical protein
MAVIEMCIAGPVSVTSALNHFAARFVETGLKFAVLPLPRKIPL